MLRRKQSSHVIIVADKRLSRYKNTRECSSRRQKHGMLDCLVEGVACHAAPCPFPEMCHYLVVGVLPHYTTCRRRRTSYMRRSFEARSLSNHRVLSQLCLRNPAVHRTKKVQQNAPAEIPTVRVFPSMAEGSMDRSRYRARPEVPTKHPILPESHPCSARNTDKSYD